MWSNKDWEQDADQTFYAQSAYVIPVYGKKVTFIMAFDRHKKENLRESSYVWLPIKFDNKGITIEWQNSFGVVICMCVSMMFALKVVWVDMFL